MENRENALAMINEIIGWAIGNDYMGYLENFEEEYEMTIDEALKIIEKEG